ncbi:hypothetical protein IWQ56_002382 [Coemansia nantahalensis]|nr:hypothetical protein IWQ56_002382 [Coemansia nantahalensis]
MPLQAADEASKPKASPAADRAATDPSNKSNSGEEDGKDEGEDKDKDAEDEELDTEEDEEEEVCGICLSGDFTQSNQIVFCEGKCGLGFHQKCYGIDTIPPGDEPWYCDVCAADQFGKMCSGYMYCCHYKHGLICRRLTIQDRPHEKHFAHVLCAVHMPYVDTSTVPFTTDVPKVTGDPIYCYFCDGRYGFQVRCSHPDEGGGSDDGRCQITFHPMCAFVNGFIKMPGVHSQPPEEYTCPEHDPSTRDGPLGQIRRKRLEKLHTSTAKSKKKIRRQEAQLERRLAAYGESSPRHKHSEKTRALSAKGAKRDVKPSLAKESPSHRVATRAALRGKDHAPSRNIAPVDIDDVEDEDDDDDRTESLTVTPADKQASARPKHRDDSTEVLE